MLRNIYRSSTRHVLNRPTTPTILVHPRFQRLDVGVPVLHFRDGRTTAHAGSANLGIVSLHAWSLRLPDRRTLLEELLLPYQPRETRLGQGAQRCSARVCCRRGGTGTDHRGAEVMLCSRGEERTARHHQKDNSLPNGNRVGFVSGSSALCWRRGILATRTRGHATPSPALFVGTKFSRGRQCDRSDSPFHQSRVRTSAAAAAVELTFAWNRAVAIPSWIALCAVVVRPNRRWFAVRTQTAGLWFRLLTHIICKGSVMSRRYRRFAFTLLELLVVLVIIMILAAAVLLRLNGSAAQANAAVGTSVIADINKAVSLFEAKYGKSPNGWDGILTASTGGFYSQLNPAIQTSTGSADKSLPILQELTLTALQLKSLNDAGITFLHYNGGTNTGQPSDSGTAFKFLATGDKVASLMIPLTGTTPAWSGHGSTFPDRALNIHPFNKGGTESFVVFGIGQPCSLRGSTLQEAPIVQAADPAKYYSRVFCVYMIPNGTATTGYTAQFVGCFLPDGTAMGNNVAKFNSADVPLEN